MLSNMFPEAVGCRAAALSAPPPASARSSVGRDATGRPYAAVRQLLLPIYPAIDIVCAAVGLMLAFFFDEFVVPM